WRSPAPWTSRPSTPRPLTCPSQLLLANSSTTLQPITLQEAAEAMRAELIGPPDDEFEGICTDTREGAAGKLFFALLGENSDGHAYVDAAFRQGAAACVVERLVANSPGPLLGVPNSLVALGDLASFVRSWFDIPVVGVTGS